MEKKNQYPMKSILSKTTNWFSCLTSLLVSRILYLCLSLSLSLSVSLSLTHTHTQSIYLSMCVCVCVCVCVCIYWVIYCYWSNEKEVIISKWKGLQQALNLFFSISYDLHFWLLHALQKIPMSNINLNYPLNLLKRT